MFHPAVFLLIGSLLLPALLSAGEVANLRSDFSSSRLIIKYDITAGSMGTENALEVQLEINGKTYTSNMLSLSGDFGRSITPGADRQIIWNHPRDFPEGLETAFKLRINTQTERNVINEGWTPAEGFRNSWFAVNRQTVVEILHNLMWVRNADMSAKPMKYADALLLVENLNRERFAGYADWRLPNRDDFEGLMLFGKKSGWGTGLGHFIANYLATCGFDNVQAGYYWTATQAGISVNSTYAANTWNGTCRPLEKNNYYYAWPVRTVR